MTRQEVTDEMLMAFADGELDDTEMARIAGAIDADPTLAARVDAFLQSRALSKAALGPLLAEPVPKALEDAVRRMAEGAAFSASTTTGSASTASSPGAVVPGLFMPAR